MYSQGRGPSPAGQMGGEGQYGQSQLRAPRNLPQPPGGRPQGAYYSFCYSVVVVLSHIYGGQIQVLSLENLMRLFPAK